MMTGDQAIGSPQDPAGDNGTATAAPHPEEMKASVEFHAGNCISMKATARATPAGLAAAAVLMAAILIPVMRFGRRK
jgi:DUF1365 family protein